MVADLSNYLGVWCVESSCKAFTKLNVGATRKNEIMVENVWRPVPSLPHYRRALVTFMVRNNATHHHFNSIREHPNLL